MEIKFKHIAIIGTHSNPCVADTVLYLNQYLQKYATIYLEKDTAAEQSNNTLESYSLDFIAKNCDLAIVVGGDGNFLNAGRSLSLIRDIPIVGINRGKLGFLTDITPEQIKQRLLPILKGRYTKETRFMLQANIQSQKQKYDTTVALNDIVIAAGQHSRLFQMHISIDGRYAFDQRADGIIIATPTGSTAHALSAGGPIMHPSLDAIVLVPMYSHSLNSRPIVINAQSTVEIVIGEYNAPQPSLSFDGHTKATLQPNDCVALAKCTQSVTILHPKDYDYFHSLRTKLHWGKMLFP
ncbi:NAD(+) kinase [Facilibium subflavum]|uniref:NAD(+) kinase n=1 Tax=Facilibium subflavum TaxID=2219058 RepID=UPI000E646AF8|nr:NAD(+) kinase [Facilibium subflavum]